MDLTVEVQREGSEYWARVVELSGCFASGRTLDELKEALADAIGLYLWDEPRAVVVSDGPLEVGEVQIEVVEVFR